MIKKRLQYILPYILVAVMIIAIWWYMDHTRRRTYCSSLSLGENEPRMLKNGKQIEDEKRRIPTLRFFEPQVLK